MKTLVLRFDIDTYRCIKEGVPNLLQLAGEEGVKFTFFCNMGRAVSRTISTRNLIRRPGSPTEVSKLPVKTKLGFYHTAWTLLVNPKVGSSFPETLQQAHKQGHDIGLHGGNNHASWQHGFPYWDESQIRREVAAGKAMYQRLLGTPPKLFSSPGWQGSSTLNTVLKQTGFDASADRHGVAEEAVVCEDGFCTLPTNLVGEPGGVAYFEHLRARGLGHKETVDYFCRAVTDTRKLYVLYDHPCFAGTQALGTLRAVLRSALDRGMDIVRFSDLIRRYRSH